jgi:hypothetical protein
LTAKGTVFYCTENEKIDQDQTEKERRIKRVAPKKEEKAEKQQQKITYTRRAGKIKYQENGEKKEKESWGVKCHDRIIIC